MKYQVYSFRFFLVIVLASGCLLFGLQGPATAQPSRPSDVSLKSLRQFDKMLQQGTLQLSSNQAGRAKLERIGQRVATQCRRPVPWKFELLADTEPNAFTLGEGLVVVTDGLLALNLSDDELAGVVGHEVAHGALQHIVQANLNRELLVSDLKKIQAEIDEMNRQYSTGRMPAYVYQSRKQFVLSRMGDLQNRLDRLESQEKFAKELSHESEIEADLVGLRYVVGAGYSADGLALALEKLRQRGIKLFGKDFTGGGKSHPALSLRIMLLSKAQSRLSP